MKCYNCRSDLTPVSVENYQYKECGLDNVYLNGISVFECACGETFVSIPSVPSLHNLIGRNLLRKKSVLNGKEIRFLRKNMGFTAKELSKTMGVDNATFSRWEKGSQNIKPSHDRLIRLLYSINKNLPHMKEYIEETFQNISQTQTEILSFKIPSNAWIEPPDGTPNFQSAE